MRDEQKEYLANDIYNDMMRNGKILKKDFSNVTYDIFRKVYDFLVGDFCELEDFFAKFYEDDADFQRAGLDEDCEGIEELENAEYVKNVVNPQINSLNRR